MIHVVSGEGTIDGLDWKLERSVPTNEPQAARADVVGWASCSVERT